MDEAESRIRNDAEATASPSDFERLKRLLFGDEREAIDAAGERLARIERTQRDLPVRLPEAIERAQSGEGGSTRMARALARPVTQALGSAVRDNRQVIVDVLFPVIGPAIRKAIAEALRNLVADLNGAIESSFTLRGLKWRVEAWRSGVPYAQIVLKHTLSYRVDHVFLIARGSGLVLARESSPDLPDLDADAIAGMLTAIGEFVHDSLGNENDASTLDAARVGEHVLWVVQGPRANLACFIRGVPPARLHAVLEQRLEDIHADLGDPADPAVIDAGLLASLRPDALSRDAGDAAPARRAVPRWPLWLLLVAALALAGWFALREYRWSTALDALRARLQAHPGFVLTGIDADDHASLTVHGLLDADAEPITPDLVAAPAGAKVHFDTAGYVSSDDSIVARRAHRLLAVPDGVAVAVRDGVLALSGRADAAWIATARERAAWVPGVHGVDLSLTANSDPAALARRRLDALAVQIAARRIGFDRATEPAADGGAILDGIAADAKQAESLARSAGVAIEWTAVGTNDEPGSDALNARLRAARARWLAGELARRGVTNVAIAADDDADAAHADRRAAFVRLTIAGPRP